MIRIKCSASFFGIMLECEKAELFFAQKYVDSWACRSLFIRMRGRYVTTVVP